LRRSSSVLASLAALVVVVPAGASLQPVRRDFGELQAPRLRAGTIDVSATHRSGRVRVVVRLAQPPLAAWRAENRTRGSVAREKLDVGASSSRAYLARLAEAQRAAVARLRREVPEARIGRRFSVLLNALTVDLPARSLPMLVRQPFATRVYPSLRYTLATNASPALIGAGAAAVAKGMDGAGVKIGVVDDGVDPTNPFFRADGFAYPAGFPRGGARWTSPKVIVARSFPGPGAGKAGRLAVDPNASFHGTHVAGIAAGVAGTTAAAGPDHPATSGLSGVAPRAWIGNYRVFNVPTPLGNQALTPEIIAAFEAAVADGMDVINFSGGGPASEPVNDALIETIANVVAAGVVPVISSGNDRDEFGYGTAGSPGTAPDAISVAAVGNRQVFSQALTVASTGERIAFRPALETRIPAAWASNQTLTDVGTIVGSDGRPVDRFLCGPAGNPNQTRSTLPGGSLAGRIALASRGRCAFVTKAAIARAAGATGLVLVDNRAGEANPIPVPLVLPSGTVSDLDGARLRGLASASGGSVGVRITSGIERIENDHSGVITSFSSAGPTAFGHDLKPDVSAPGGQILSSTLPRFGGPFAVFDGTSMSAPHVSGAAALLVQRHPGWTPQQIKSALAATAGPAWADTARTVEAPVTLGGAGLVDVLRADDPKVFTEPSSASFGDLRSAEGLLVRVTDADGGSGTWSVELMSQAATSGASLDLPAAVVVPPGGEATLSLVARATAGATGGENYGFVVLRRGADVRRIPYFFLVSRPALAAVAARRLARFQTGDTRTGTSVVSRYGYPTAPFGQPADFGSAPPMQQDGAEKLYAFSLREPAANLGAVVLAATTGSVVDPWLLGAKDENSVQGYAGTPVNVNPLTFSYRFDIGAAGATFPRPATYYLAVDAGRDPFTGRLLAGQFVLQSWVNDVLPPLIAPVTTRVAAGRPTLVARVVDIGGTIVDPGSGVDPLSLTIGYRNVLVGAAAYDPISGIAIFPLPSAAPKLQAGSLALAMLASDNQEAKNVNVAGEDVLPNTSIRETRLRVVNGPTDTWIFPERLACLERRERLVVVAGSTATVRSVRFTIDGRRIATVRRGAAGLYTADWRPRGLGKGRHVLRSVVTDARGRTAEAQRPVRACS
jgi:minor extracellular serine protease Vpr